MRSVVVNRKYMLSLLVLMAMLLLRVSPARSQVVQDSVPELQKMDVVEHLGETIPLDLEFTNDAGEKVHLGDYFHHGKPVILTLNYYSCPMLCTVVLNGLSDGVKGLEWTPGEQYQMLTVSFDPKETADLAAGKKYRYVTNLETKGNETGWRFFVGEQSQSQALADALGFKFYYDEETKQYAHPAVVFVLTEDGKISRYLYGLEFKKQDLKLALLEASEGKIGNTIDRLILYCYHYDPTAKGYVVFAANLMKLGGGISLVVLGIFLGTLWARERVRSRSIGHAV